MYFGVLCIYAVFGLFVLWKVKEPALLMNIASNFYNIAFGFSCWHVVYINTRLLPKPLRPGWGVCIFLSLAGIFFWCIAGISAIKIYRDLMGVV